MQEIVVAWVSYPEESQAKKMAATLAKKRLAAGINIMGPVSSVYWWQGHLQSHEEWLLFAQLPEKLFPEFKSEILSCHPYEIPCVMALPVRNAHTPFLQWVYANCLEK